MSYKQTEEQRAALAAYWADVFSDPLHEPATLEENLAGARGIYARLSGFKPKAVIDEGQCDDCTRDSKPDEVPTAPRYRIGAVLVCQRCAHMRLGVARKLEAPPSRPPLPPADEFFRRRSEARARLGITA